MLGGEIQRVRRFKENEGDQIRGYILYETQMCNTDDEHSIMLEI